MTRMCFKRKIKEREKKISSLNAQIFLIKKEKLIIKDQ